MGVIFANENVSPKSTKIRFEGLPGRKNSLYRNTIRFILDEERIRRREKKERERERSEDKKRARMIHTVATLPAPNIHTEPCGA